MDAAIWASLLLIAALVVLVLEFIIPSAGILSIVCAVLFIAAIVVGFADSVLTGATIMVVEVVLIPVVLALAIKVWPHTPLGRKMLLTPPENPDDVLPERLQSRELDRLIGKRGIAKSLMLPSGAIEIAGVHYDATSEGQTIELGTKVIVVKVSMNSLVVRPDTTIVAELSDSYQPSQAAQPSKPNQPESDNPLDQQMPDPFA